MSGERRTLQNYAYWSSRKTHESPPGPGPTLDYLQRSSSWWWYIASAARITRRWLLRRRSYRGAPMHRATSYVNARAARNAAARARPSSIRHGAATASALCRFLLRVLRSPMSQPCRVELPEDFGKAQKCSETNANKLQHDATRNRSQNSKKCLILLVPGERIELATDGLQSRASFALLQ